MVPTMNYVKTAYHLCYEFYYFSVYLVKATSYVFVVLQKKILTSFLTCIDESKCVICLK